MNLAFIVVKISGPPWFGSSSNPPLLPASEVAQRVGWMDRYFLQTTTCFWIVAINDMNFEAADIRNRRCMYEHLERSSVSSVGLEHCSDESSVFKKNMRIEV